MREYDELSEWADSVRAEIDHLRAVNAELLEALELCLNWFNWWASDCEGPPKTQAFEARNAAQAAIAKARGDGAIVITLDPSEEKDQKGG